MDRANDAMRAQDEMWRTGGDFARADGVDYRSAAYQPELIGNGLQVGRGGYGVQPSQTTLRNWAAEIDGGIALNGSMAPDNGNLRNVAQVKALNSNAAAQAAMAASVGMSKEQAGAIYLAAGGRAGSNSYGPPVTSIVATAGTSAVKDSVGDWIRSLNLPKDIPGVGWLSREQAVSSAQHWASKLDSTGNPLYALAQGAANLWADHAQEVGMVAMSTRGIGAAASGRFGTVGAPPEGVVYLRTDRAGGLAPYGGQAQSEARYIQRQTEHARAHPDADFEFQIVGRANPGVQLDIAEHNFIQQLTGGVAARNSPLVSNLKDPMGYGRRLDNGLPEPKRSP